MNPAHPEHLSDQARVTDLNDVRLLRDMDELAKAEARVRALKLRVADGCRHWSIAHGYRVVLRPEAVRSEIERNQP